MRTHPYHRISQDSKKKGLGIERQRKVTATIAERLEAARAAEPYEDNDKSATNGKERPRYEQMLRDIRSGVIASGDVIVAYNQDRLVRDVIELEHLIALCREHGVGLHTQSGEVNVQTADGRTHARLLGVIAKGETEKLGERIRAKLEQNAADGVPHGAVKYGWRREVELDENTGARKSWRDVVNEPQAEIVREIARRLVAGEKVLGIARDLNNRKVPPPSPRITAWTGMAVRGLVKRQRNIGKRVHHGEVVGNGNWDAILDEEVFVQVRAILGDPKRRTSPGNQPRHLLSLIARCGVCGSHMAAAMNRRPVYRCKGRGCASRRIDVMDAHVEEVVLQWFASGEAQELLAAQGDDRSMEALQRAQALRLELDALADDFYVHKVIDREQFVRISVGKRRELERAQEQASQVLGRPVWADLVRQDPAHRAHLWKEMPLGRKRSVLAELFEITVHRSKLGRGVWDPESVEIRQRNDVEPTEG